MKTFILDIFSRVQNFSNKLDNQALLTNKHWVLLDESKDTRTIYIFRTNNELIISNNGIVEKGHWEYISKTSILIDKKEASYLFKHGFLTESILALQIDDNNQYAVFVEETIYSRDLNNIDSISAYINNTYFEPNKNSKLDIGKSESSMVLQGKTETYKTDKGELIIEVNHDNTKRKIFKAYQNNKTAKDGKYKIGFMHYITVKNGVVIGNSIS